MRFKLQPEPWLGCERIIKKFAILPIKIDYEIRWLETVTIKQKYAYHLSYVDACWHNICFIDNEQETSEEK